jgi:16S rRNA (guanine966-N2)-methyltransferase
VTRQLAGTFDLVFIDPPYDENPFESVLTGIEGAGALAGGATVFAEHSSRLQLPDDLPGVRLASRRRYGDSSVSVYRKDPEQDDAGTGNW